MRILLVVDSLDPGGAERHVINLAIALHARGHVVAVACSTGGLWEEELIAAEVPVCQLMRRPIKRRLSLIYAWRLRVLLRQTPVNVVHAHCFASSVAAALATWKSPSALVVTEHSEAVWQWPLSRWVNRRLHRRADGSIAVSWTIAARLTGSASASHYVRVIHNVIPAEGVPRQRSGAFAEVRHRPYQLVGVIARLQHEKGVHLFLEVLSQLPTVRGVVVGDGPRRAWLESRARMLGLQSRVCFLGQLSCATSVLRRIDVLAVPSLSEGSPLVVLEAMAAGVPVVASRVGGIPELLRDREHGLLTPPGDVPAMARAIARVLGDEAYAHELARTARAHVRARFPFEGMVLAVEQVYRDAVS